MAGDDLPETVQDWYELASERRLANESIHAGYYRYSGSNMVLGQFLLFHVVWPGRLEHDDGLIRHWPDATLRQKARNHLSSSTAWTAYLKSIDRGWRVGRQLEDLKEFSLVRQFQLPLAKTAPSNFWSQPKLLWEPGPPAPPGSSLQIMNNNIDFTREDVTTDPESPTPNLNSLSNDIDMASITSVASSSSLNPLSSQHSLIPGTSETIEAVKDEELVNMSVIVFLQSLIVHCDAVLCEWSPHRKGFIFKKVDRNVKIYEARVDGYLESVSEERICAIVEVKPFARDEMSTKEIRMQEAAQMVAWIHAMPPARAEVEHCRNENREMTRLLVSQDRHGIFLTLATFDAAYVDYVLYDVCNAQKSFLKMREFGPYDVFNSVQMNLVGEILLAFAMKECSVPSNYRV